MPVKPRADVGQFGVGVGHSRHVLRVDLERDLEDGVGGGHLAHVLAHVGELVAPYLPRLLLQKAYLPTTFPK